MTINEIVELTQSLIRFKSMNARPDQITECADFICGYLAQHDIRFERLEHDGVPSIAALPGTDFAPVLLMAHFDVVAGPDHLFVPRIQNGRLYGRGSIDDKYAAALSLVMLKNELGRLKRLGKEQADASFGILLTGDEEVGGINGAQHALSRLRTDFCIALDGGSPKRIVVKEKGVMRLKLTARGKTAHGARPWLGTNAIEALVADYQKIRVFFQRETPDHWHRTLNWGIVRAGESVNQVPDLAEAWLDIRFTEADDMDALVAEIRAAIAGEIEIQEQWPLFTSGDSAYLHRLQHAAGAELVFEHGASDARFLSSYGMAGVVWGADGEMSQHSADEHVVIESIRQVHDALAAFMETASQRGQ
ncbi:MAG: M20/M25/M40 family metallo-hydrolase [Desulfobacteraceae bacterium]|jgi:succinyl-diaminopimelate desuccinylase|nr:M20/M25/M40 family metallo-hydrolase [Desulfobacteraceae bacterium]